MGRQMILFLFLSLYRAFLYTVNILLPTNAPSI